MVAVGWATPSAAVRAGKIAINRAGHTVFVYRDGTKDCVTVEIGVEIAAPFDAVDGVAYSQTPPGDVVSTVHVGAYSGLGAAYDALVGWCGQSQLARAGVWWEVYGDWHEDPGQVETEVFQLLSTEPT